MTSAQRGMVTAHNQFLYAVRHVVQLRKRENWAEAVVLQGCICRVLAKSSKNADAEES